MNDKDMKRHYVIRFINTRLAGCEYVIREESSTFLVADRDALAVAQQQACDPAAIYVLDDTISTAFDIVWRADMPLPVLVRPQESVATGRAINFHQAIEIDGVSVVLRPEGEELLPEPVPETEWLSEASDSTNVALPAAPSVSRRRYPWMGTMALLVLLCGLAGYYLMSRQQAPQPDKLSLALGGKPDEFTTFVGRDGGVYIFAREPHSSARARQSLVKSHTDRQISVLSAREQEDKITRELGARWPQLKFHAVRFDEPVRPEIILSQERAKMINHQELQQIAAKLLSLFPWASDFNFSYISDQRIADNAEQGLKGIVSFLEKRNNADSVTFSVAGALNDSELNELKTFVNGFRAKWRGDYIQFDIRLEDNPVKGKSYLYGDRNYIKLTKDQWYFH